MQREAPREIETIITCMHEYVIVNRANHLFKVRLTMENHLESHSRDETDECTTEEDQTKDGKVDQVSSIL